MWWSVAEGRIGGRVVYRCGLGVQAGQLIGSQRVLMGRAARLFPKGVASGARVRRQP